MSLNSALGLPVYLNFTRWESHPPSPPSSPQSQPLSFCSVGPSNCPKNMDITRICWLINIFWFRWSECTDHLLLESGHSERRPGLRAEPQPAADSFFRPALGPSDNRALWGAGACVHRSVRRSALHLFAFRTRVCNHDWDDSRSDTHERRALALRLFPWAFNGHSNSDEWRSCKQKAQLKEIFDLFDTDGGGTIDRQEVSCVSKCFALHSRHSIWMTKNAFTPVTGRY